MTRKKWLILGSWWAAAVIAVIGIGVTKSRTLHTTNVRSSPIRAIDSNSYKRLEMTEREAPFFTLQASNESKYGLQPSSNFVLTSREDAPVEVIKNSLKTNIPFEVKKLSGKQFELKPVSTLGLDQVVTIKLARQGTTINNQTVDRDYGWAYETEEKFRLVSTLPGDKKTDVPVNTGIELTFSQADFTDPTPLIEISPNIPFKTQRRGEVFVIIPQQALMEKTLYTIKLKAGLRLESRNDSLTQDQVFSFQTQELSMSTQRADLSLWDNFVQSGTTIRPAVKVYQNGVSEVEVEIYRFGSGAQFVDSRKMQDQDAGRWYRYFDDETQINTNGLTKIANLKLPVARITENEYTDTDYLQFPTPLAEGFYLIKIYYNDHKGVRNLWLQSTDVSGYLSIGRFQTLVWVNSLTTKTAIGSAKVRVLPVTGSESYTDASGITVFKTPEEWAKKSGYVEVTDKQGSLYLPVGKINGAETADKLTPGDYWTYLYNERYKYKPTDVINYWGTVRLRDTGVVPSEAEVRLTRGGDGIVDLSQVKFGVNGTYGGKIEFQDLPAGWYELDLMIGGLVVARSGIEIEDFRKPDIQITIESDHQAIFAGQKTKFAIKNEFFDRTPVKNVELKVYEDVDGGVVSRNTDSQGKVNYEYESKYTTYQDYPRYESVTVSPALAGSVVDEGYGSVFVYGSKLWLEASSDQQDNQAKVVARVNHVDLSKYRGERWDEVKGAVAKQVTVKAKVKKVWWEIVQEGTYYDFVEKVTRPKYSYTNKSEVLPELEQKTNESGLAEFGIAMEKDRGYEIRLETVDEDNHVTVNNQYLYNYADSYRYQSGSANEHAELTLTKTDNFFGVGEEVGFEITKGGKTYSQKVIDRYLFTVAGRGRQDFFVEETPELKFKFAEKMIPNVYVGAIIFDGREYMPVSSGCRWDWYCYYDYGRFYFDGVQVNYKTENSKLDLKLVTPGGNQKPGSKVTLEVDVTRGGAPVKGAAVQIAMVDEALAAIGGVRKPTILSEVYRTTPADIYLAYYSHVPVIPNIPAAEKGGGGGEARQVFKDTAVFETAVSDEVGVAKFEILLPDNLTTWIVYSQAIDSNMAAGQTEGKVVASKDFFVTNQLPPELVMGDEAQVTANSFGRLLDSGKSVNYVLRLLNGDQELAKKTAFGKSGSDTMFEMGTLGIGNYSAELMGQYGSFGDGVKIPFSVQESRMEAMYDAEVKIDKVLNKNIFSDLPKAKSTKPVKLILTDEGGGKYYWQLANWCYVSSNRLEKLLAKSKSDDLLKRRFSESGCPNTDNLAKFQNSDGGLGQVVWGSSDLLTSAWAAAVKANEFDRVKLSGYFERQVDRPEASNRDKLIAVWGLNELNKNKLSQIKLRADQAYGIEERVVAGLALAMAGDTEQAREIYLNILADYGYASTPYIRIQNGGSGDNTEEVRRNTAWVATLGEYVDDKYLTGMDHYLSDYNMVASEDLVTDLATIAGIDRKLKIAPVSPAEISVHTKIKQVEVRLEKGERKTIELSADELQGLDLTIKSGKTNAVFQYVVDGTELQKIAKDSRLQLKRTYRGVHGENKITVGDIVEVSLKYDFGHDSPLGGFLITDLVPSGFVYLNEPEKYGLKNSYWPTRQDNNVVSFWVYNYPWWRTNAEIRYYVRAAYPGKFVAEPALIQAEAAWRVMQSTTQEVINISGN